MARLSAERATGRQINCKTPEGIPKVRPDEGLLVGWSFALVLICALVAPDLNAAGKVEYAARPSDGL
jgi:hypothetical protein